MIQVVAGIIFKEGKLLIARRASHKSLPGKWEFPGGKIEPTESPEQALERELLEEFSVTTKTGKFLCKNEHDYGAFEIELLAYESYLLKGEFQLSDHDRIDWVNMLEMKNYEFTKADIPIVSHLIKNIKDIY